ncbi:unnamed protein product [Cyprideis torosa]|uniref:Bridge-like lipid transfer protein family member 1 C-terminal domain-containing protein n=1 Tax=Cyprideis torosa TaxID=163714 RepID=A0A7R8WI83_9CRUS|nr:unnamed protein product [Cyprideis torosa]CAG0900380.1 unnamed protein product [Cyprideis torosa]
MLPETRKLLHHIGLAGGTHIVQHLSFSLGPPGSIHHERLGSVCRISRSAVFPPQFKTLHEWFHFAFSPNDLDDVERFPTMSDVPDPQRRVPSKLQDHSHTTEVIFAFPGLQLDMKTDHWQTELPPSGHDPKPAVEVTFVTEFADHIFVTVDAEGFFFLHDLLASYIGQSEDTLDSAANGSGRKTPRMEQPRYFLSVIQEKAKP